MIVVIDNWKKKLLKILCVLVLFLAFALAVPVLTGLFYQQVPAMSSWLKEEHPSGNPLRVEEVKDGSKFEQVVDQFVIKLQNFYYEEKN
ncbi:MAG: hypothetical protein PHE26_11230 [Syntrophomonadaceae bacterium]|nr:hypothetical protein [Syntrophomonadaceae bacterium]